MGIRDRRKERRPLAAHVEDLLQSLDRAESPEPGRVRELVALHRAAIRSLAAQKELIGKLGRENAALRKPRRP